MSRSTYAARGRREKLCWAWPAYSVLISSVASVPPAAADRALAAQQLTRAARYRELEINALRYAEHATDPAGRRSLLDSAQEHAGSAWRLEEYSRLLRAKADAAEAYANELEVASDRRQPAPQSQDTD